MSCSICSVGDIDAEKNNLKNGFDGRKLISREIHLYPEPFFKEKNETCATFILYDEKNLDFFINSHLWIL